MFDVTSNYIFSNAYCCLDLLFFHFSKVKISDYGISQFVTSQGAKGHVGTPGFMAPEILKYLGKEAYNEKVDIFSYAMVMYEMITLRVPFEHLTPNQANQANESGTRPTMKKKVYM